MRPREVHQLRQWNSRLDERASLLADFAVSFERISLTRHLKSTDYFSESVACVGNAFYSLTRTSAFSFCSIFRHQHHRYCLNLLSSYQGHEESKSSFTHNLTGAKNTFLFPPISEYLSISLPTIPICLSSQTFCLPYTSNSTLPYKLRPPSPSYSKTLPPSVDPKLGAGSSVGSPVSYEYNDI